MSPGALCLRIVRVRVEKRAVQEAHKRIEEASWGRANERYVSRKTKHISMRVTDSHKTTNQPRCARVVEW